MPWSRVLSFADPLPYRAAIRASNWEVYPTKRGQFEAELTQSESWIQRFHQKVPVVQMGTAVGGRKVVGLLTEGRQPSLHHRGMEISSHDVVVNTGVMHQRTEGDCRVSGCP
jgi:hypothetical protein